MMRKRKRRRKKKEEEGRRRKKKKKEEERNLLLRIFSLSLSLSFLSLSFLSLFILSILKFKEYRCDHLWFICPIFPFLREIIKDIRFLNTFKKNWEKKTNLKPTPKGGGGEGSVWKRSSFLISFFSPLSPSDCGSRGYLSWIELQDI